ncbi:hypothetical protein GpartN1_g3041.t1 [Galdieria partita]|uniref:Probable ATP-dependent transporter ycf16 n=1 Tax=Galdieria partita TaxID=83374 RepID=A0A9C7PVT2_9RHOD|nr:hypothetical protein GpartN1_g3041.t1 [Galdieria partita]
MNACCKQTYYSLTKLLSHVLESQKHQRFQVPSIRKLNLSSRTSCHSLGCTSPTNTPTGSSSQYRFVKSGNNECLATIEKNWTIVVKRRLCAESSQYTSTKISSQNLSFWQRVLKRLSNFRRASSKTNVTEQTVQEEFVSWRKLFSLAKPESKMLSLALLAQMVSVGTTMIFPMAVGKIVDIIQLPNSVDQLKWMASALAGLFVVGAVAVTVRVALMTTIGERIARDLRKQVFKSLMKQELAFFDGRQSGELVNRLSNDTSVVSKTLTENLARGIRSSVTTTGGIGFLIYLSPTLTVAALSFIPFLTIVGGVYGSYVRSLSKKLQDALAAATQVASERISAIRTVRLFAGESIEASRYTQRIEDAFQLAKKVAIAEGFYMGGGFFMGQASLLAVLWFGGHQVLQGAMTVGQLASFAMYAVNVGFGVSSLANGYGQLTRAQGAGARIFAILDRKPCPLTGITESEMESSLYSGSSHIPHVENYRTSIIFDQVHFYYPSRPQHSVFKGLSFQVEPGELLAITGMSGCGKSTILSLLSRLYIPQEGHIYLGGYDINSLDINWLRRQIGAVPQDVVLFDGSILENISYGAGKDVSMDEILRAATVAGADYFIRQLPYGYETQVGERGLSLSGGQRQRIALARAIVRRPRILILDEATSALDVESEASISEAVDLLRRKEDMCTIVIAHRLSTLRDSNHVIVLNKGVVAESGKFDELIAKPKSILSRLMLISEGHGMEVTDDEKLGRGT